MNDPRLYEFRIRWYDYDESHADVCIQPKHVPTDGCDWHDFGTDYRHAWGYISGVAARAGLALCGTFGPVSEDDPRHASNQGELSPCCGSPRATKLAEPFDVHEPPTVFLEFPRRRKAEALGLVRRTVAEIVTANATPTNVDPQVVSTDRGEAA